MSTQGAKARTKARRRALEVLFQAEVRGENAADILEYNQSLGDRMGNAYTAEVVAGIAESQNQIDEQLASYSHGWSLERMPAVDRTALRIAAWEIMFNDEVPDAVAIDEAVKAVAELSTDESPKFVNGLLDRISKTKPV